MHTRGREGQIFGLFKRMHFIDNPIAHTLYPLDRSDKSIKFTVLTDIIPKQLTLIYNGIS